MQVMSRLTNIASSSGKLQDVSQLASILGKSEKEVNKIIKKYSLDKKTMFSYLIDIYNAGGRNEAPEIITRIVKNLKEIKTGHYELLENINTSLANIQRIFEDINNKSEKLDFANKMANSFTKEARPEMIAEALESRNHKEYIKYFDKYKSYFIVNEKNENAVKELDTMVERGTYNPNKYNFLSRKKTIQRKYATFITENVSSDDMAKHYSKSGISYLNSLKKNVGISHDEMVDGLDFSIFYIYKTTNKKNLSSRVAILEHFESCLSKSDKKEEFGELTKLYCAIDANDNIRRFVDYLVKKEYGIKSLKEVNDLITNFSSEKLGIFYKNAVNIINQTKPQERLAVLEKEIENPFYESKRTKRMKEYGYYKAPGILKSIAMIVENLINKLKYASVKGTAVRTVRPVITEQEQAVDKKELKTTIQETAKPQIIEEAKEEIVPVKPVETKIEPEFVKTVEEVNEGLVKTEPVQIVQEPVVEEIIEEAPQKSVEQVTNKTAKVQQKENAVESRKTVKPTSLPKSEYNEMPIIKYTKTKASQELKDGVLDFIQKKLGVSTYAKQRDDFSQYTSKLRFSMLPEIFASIADTRKADRAVGKMRINSSNQDALELFKLINYNNKKFVNYLLKKRNVDGTRMFEAKDIIGMLQKAETRIAKEKLTNPNYKSRDARQYYNHLHEAKVQQYGKLKPQPRPKKNNKV